MARAQLTACATDWDNFANNPGYISEYTFQGGTISDEETSADTSHGPASVPPDWTDLASGSPSNFPGPHPTPYFGYYNGGTAYDPDDPVTMEDDYIFFRIRIQGDPVGGSAFDSKHWNVLFDVDDDGYKEYWIDLQGDYQSGNGKRDRLQVLYDDAARQDIDDPDDVRVEQFTAYYAEDNDASCPAGSPGLSHTRTYAVGDGTGDYFIELQVPMTALDDLQGNQVVYPTSPVSFVFSTGASNTNPLQKDFMNDLDFLTLNDPITFGDTIIPNGQPQIEFTNADGDFVDFYYEGDDIYVMVTDRLANTDSSTLQCILVTVTNPATFDDETVSACETQPNSGIFTNRGGATKASISYPSPAPSPETAWIPAIRTTSTVLQEDWTVTYDSGAGNWIVEGSVSGVQTARASHGTPYVSDGGEISFTIYEDSPADGTELSFSTEAADPLTSSLTAGSDNDSDLQTFALDQIQASYVNQSSITVTDTADIVGPCRAFVQFTRASGLPTNQFEITADPGTSDQLYITVFHPEANTNPGSAQSFDVTLTGNDTETLTLTETGPDTGEFRNSTGLETQIDDGSVTAEDGLWEDIDDGLVTVTYGYSCGGSTYSESTEASVFFTGGGGDVFFTNGAGTVDVEVYSSGRPIFLKVVDENACTVTVGGIETVDVTVESDTGDTEDVTLYETFPGSGVFMNRTNDLVTANGSAVVTSASSTFISDGLAASDPFVIANGPDTGTYTIASVDSETQITLDSALTADRFSIGFQSVLFLAGTYDGSSTADDGVLEAVHEDGLEVRYFDCDDGDSSSANDIKTDDARYSAPPILINEVLFYPDFVNGSSTACQTEGIELYNNTDGVANATGYVVTDGDSFSYTVPQFQGSDIELLPGEYIFISLWGYTSTPSDRFLGNTYYLFTNVGSTYPSDVLGDPLSGDPADQLTLSDPGGEVVDYVGWSITTTPSTDFFSDDSSAVLAGIWQDDAFRDISSLVLGEAIVRTSNGFDTDEPSDWSFFANDVCQRISTRALISDFHARRTPEGVEVEWQTSSEDGALGFRLHRWSDDAGEWAPLHEDLIPALIEQPQGGTYRFVDSAAPGQEILSYAVVELETRAATTRETVHGPFTIEVEPGDSRSVRRKGGPPDGLAESRARELSAHQRSRLARGLRQKRSTMTVPDPNVHGRVKIAVRDEGLYRIDVARLAPYFGLRAQALAGWIRARQLRLLNQGVEIAWTPSRDGDALLFWGEASDSIYTAENIYWLEHGGARTMDSIDGSPGAEAGEEQSYQELRRVEENVFAATLAVSDPEIDYWFWDFLMSGHSAYDSQEYEVELDELAFGTTASVAVDLYGATDAGVPGEHRVAVSVNGVEVGESSWRGTRAHRVVIPISPTLLVDGVNRVGVEGLIGGGVLYSIFYVDGVEIIYPRHYRSDGNAATVYGDGNVVVRVDGLLDQDVLVLDLEDPQLPERVVGFVSDGHSGDVGISFAPRASGIPYHVVRESAAREPVRIWSDQPSQLRGFSNIADYLVVAPEEMLGAAQRLALYRAEEGLATMVVSFEDVLDEFNHGISSPHALRAFLEYAYNYWSVPPQYVVLAGGGSFDYLDHLGYGGNLLPPMMIATENGLYAADSAFADVRGNDGKPEMAIGRLPVLSSSELDAYLDKVRTFEREWDRSWRAQQLMVADDHPGGPDTFAMDVQRTVELLPTEDFTERALVSQLGAAGAREMLLDRLDSGVGFVGYFGHGGLDRIANEGLLTNNDVPGLRNQGKTPLVAGFSCAINRFEFPGFPALGELLTVAENGGAVAVWAPSGLGLNIQSRALAQSFFRLGFGEQPKRLGDLIRRSLADHLIRGGSIEDARLYNLLGDPALVF